MPERICPNCGERMTVNPTAVPLRIRCPACGGSFIQRPDVQPGREPRRAADDNGRVGADDLTGPQRATASAGWRVRLPSTHFMLAIAVIAVGAVAARITFQAWRNSRPGPTAVLAPRPPDAPPADRADDSVPRDEADVLDTTQPGMPARADLTMPDLPEADPIYVVPPAPADLPPPPAEAGVQLQPQQLQALRAARSAMDEGDLSRADEILRSLPARADGNPAVWMARGDLHSRQGDFAAAADAYQHAVDLQSESAALYQRLGDAHRRLDHPIGAINAFRRAIELNAHDAASHFGLGDVYLTQDLIAEAIAELTTAIALDDSRELYHYTLGLAYYADRQYARAAQAFRDALRLAPNEPMNPYALGNCYYALADYAKAAGAYQMAVNLNPDEPLYYYVLGNACYRLDDIERAISAYQRYIDLEPDTTRSQQVADLLARLRAQPDEP